MVEFKDLLKLVAEIKDEDLRKKTIAVLRKPTLSNKTMLYITGNFAEMPAWIGAHHTYKGGLLKHVYSVTKLVMLIGKTMCEVYGKKINMDHLIAAAMLHDLAKVWQLEKIGDKYQFSPYLLDHAVWSACELYARGFPEEIVHMVSTHGGESGGPVPKTLEATILFHADNLDASAESAAEKIILLGEGLSAKG